MDSSEKKIIGWTAVILFIFLVSIIYAAKQKKVDVTECVPYNKSFRTPGVKQIDEKTYQIFLVAKMWGFEPKEIYLPVGADADIYLSSNDVVHGCNISNKAFNMMAVPGAINKSTLHFDEPGVYKVVCHEYCGTGHANMQGEIIVNYINN